MDQLADLISRQLAGAFEGAGYGDADARATLSNRPDLCEYQCNGALPAAKLYHKAPIQIAQAVAAELSGCELFESVEAVNPGFLNMKLSGAFLAQYLTEMAQSDRLGVPQEETPKTIVLDYGGPNVAKPLHIGHLRSAIIGESVKRIDRWFGNHVIGDIHLGDWGLQMGLIIAQLQDDQPELPYFDDSFTGGYPETAPFTISELEKIYPAASARSKEDEAFAARAHDATYQLQSGKRGYRALWRHILNVSVADMKRNYEKLDVHFDVWLGESDAQPYIPKMLKLVEEKHLAVRSEGALVLPVQEDTDTKDIPPCILVKSDGATLYATRDLAAAIYRHDTYHFDKCLYVVAYQQDLHFRQIFRVLEKMGYEWAKDCVHVAFGMISYEGQALSTRKGHVVYLEDLLEQAQKKALDIINEKSPNLPNKEDIARQVGIGAVVYTDLSNNRIKDVDFCWDRALNFDGESGPYVQYTHTRCCSVLRKAAEMSLPEADMNALTDDEAQALLRLLGRFPDVIKEAAEKYEPSMITRAVTDIAQAYNKFYYEHRILDGEPATAAARVALTKATKDVIKTGLWLIGIEAPERM